MTSGQRKGQRGFSLLEVMVAFAIMALALVILYRTSGGSVSAVVDAERYDRAVSLARSILATQDAVPAEGLSQEGEDAGLAWRLRSEPYPADGGGVQLHLVEVSVVFPGGGGLRSFVLKTLLPQLNVPIKAR